jgi:hypothetical protein
MRTFEYKFAIANDLEAIDSALNDLGVQGWELVSLATPTFPGSDGKPTIMYVLKREKS